MSAITLFDLNGEQRFTGTSVGGGGAAQTATVTVTTDASTFMVVHVFDLAAPAVAYVTLTLLSEVADGETFGVGNGQISGSAGASASLNGSTLDLAQLGGQEIVQQLIAPSDVSASIVVTPRYVRCHIDLDQAPNFDIYAGPNHPTQTVRIDVTYR